ncbi:hypothetical protein F4860DRAFT_527503, partial [Xylaria cubensis]
SFPLRCIPVASTVQRDCIRAGLSVFCPVSPSVGTKVRRYTGRTPFRSLHSAICTGPRVASPEWISLLVVLSRDRTGRPCWLCTKPPWRAKTVPADESPPHPLASHHTPLPPSRACPSQPAAQPASEPARKIIKTPEHISTLPFRSRFPFLNLLPWSFSVRSVLFTNPSLFFLLSTSSFSHPPTLPGVSRAANLTLTQSLTTYLSLPVFLL